MQILAPAVLMSYVVEGKPNYPQVINELPHFVFESERLSLREMTIRDAGEMSKLYNDPEVLRYTNDEPLTSIEEAEDFISLYGQYDEFGYGRWAVIHSETREFMGWCGFKWDDELESVTMGSRFHKKFWSSGYATEAAGACIDYAFDTLGIERIVSLSFRDNLASRRVLQKLGLKPVKEINYHGHDCVYLEIERPEVSEIHERMFNICNFV